MVSRPEPPYSSGTMTPMRLRSAHFRTFSKGNSRDRSYRPATGAISFAANSRTMSRMARCSVVKSRFNARSPFQTSRLRLDETVIAVDPAVKDGDASGLGVAKDEELPLVVARLEKRFLHGHGLDREGVHSNHPRRVGGSQPHLRHAARRGFRALAFPHRLQLLPVLLRLTLQAIGDPRESGVHVTGLCGGGEGDQAISDHDLGPVTPLLHGQDDMGLGDAVEELLQLGEPFHRGAPERRGDLDLPSGEVDFHGSLLGSQRKPRRRSLEDGIRSSSRYLATVLRAIWSPS